MPYEFKVGAEGKTRAGFPYRVVVTGCRGNFPIGAEIYHHDEWELLTFTNEGKFYTEDRTEECDLMPPTRKGWINIYTRQNCPPFADTMIYETEADAHVGAKPSTHDCTTIEIEY